MSNMARSDEIDELVSSVRNLVAYKDTGAAPRVPSGDRLVLTQALRVDAPQDSPQVSDVTPETDTAGPLVLHNAVENDNQSLGATAAELEAAVTARAEDWEADGGEAFDKADWAASAFTSDYDDSNLGVSFEPHDNDAPETAAADESFTADTAHSDLELGIAQDVVLRHFASQIDETALRAAVVRILREELAGEMGERITRNVRKLVRREINRVLVSRELD